MTPNPPRSSPSGRSLTNRPLPPDTCPFFVQRLGFQLRRGLDSYEGKPRRVEGGISYFLYDSRLLGSD